MAWRHVSSFVSSLDLRPYGAAITHSISNLYSRVASSSASIQPNV